MYSFFLGGAVGRSQQGMDVSFTGILSHVEGIVKGGMESGTCTAADLCFSLQVIFWLVDYPVIDLEKRYMFAAPQGVLYRGGRANCAVFAWIQWWWRIFFNVLLVITEK